jgi:hypothetical protein
MTEVLAELEADGMVTLSHHLGPGLPRIRVTEELFLTFDPEVHETNPSADAVDLIRRILAGEDSILVADLHRESELPARRFNPALGMILDEIGEGRVSRELCLEYRARHFSVIAEDRVALKRLLVRLNA